jgi:hypothetical protein
MPEMKSCCKDGVKWSVESGQHLFIFSFQVETTSETSVSMVSLVVIEKLRKSRK